VPLRTGCRLAGAGRQRVWRQLEFRRRVRCEGLGYAVGLHRTTTVWRWICWERSVPRGGRDLPTPSGEVAFGGDLARRNEGEDVSRFATTCGAAQDDSLILAAEAVWLLMEWRMARRQRRTLPRPRCRRTCHGASSFGESSSVAHRTGVRGRQGELGWITTRAAPSALEPPCVHGAVCFAFIVASAPGLFPLGRKNCHAKASHRHDGADGNPRAALPDSFITVRLAVGASCHMVTRCPCVTDRDRWDRLCTCREHRRRLPFESVVLTTSRANTSFATATWLLRRQLSSMFPVHHAEDEHP